MTCSTVQHAGLLSIPSYGMVLSLVQWYGSISELLCFVQMPSVRQQNQAMLLGASATVLSNWLAAACVFGFLSAKAPTSP